MRLSRGLLTLLLFIGLPYLLYRSAAPASAQPRQDRENRNRQYETLEEALEEPLAVKRLTLAESELDSVPFALTKLINLQQLDLSSNRLTAVPAFVFKMPKLELLTLDNNVLLKSLPDSLRSARSLSVLSLRGCVRLDLTKTLVALTNMPALISLDLSKLELEKVPAGLARFGNLKLLYLKENNLTSVGGYIPKLAGLELLDLTGNHNFAQLPADLSGMKNLGQLILSKTRVEEFAAIKTLPALNVLEVISSPKTPLAEQSLRRLKEERPNLVVFE